MDQGMFHVGEHEKDLQPSNSEAGVREFVKTVTANLACNRSIISPISPIYKVDQLACSGRAISSREVSRGGG